MSDNTALLRARFEEMAAQADTMPEAEVLGPRPRQRNYRAMKPEKLLRCRDELLSHGDAYERCLNGGSQDPAADLALVNLLIKERGL